MPRVVIKTVAELKQLQSKFRSLAVTLPKIQTAVMNDVANDEVLEVIHRKMRANDFSPKIIDSTFVGPTELSSGKLRTHFISDYESDTGFDVSEAREEGTRDHLVKPKKIGGTLRWFAETGEPIFRKKSFPKGIERLLIIERTIKQFENRSLSLFQDKLAEKIKNLLGV